MSSQINYFISRSLRESPPSSGQRHPSPKYAPAATLPLLPCLFSPPTTVEGLPGSFPSAWWLPYSPATSFASWQKVLSPFPPGLFSFSQEDLSYASLELSPWQSIFWYRWVWYQWCAPVPDPGVPILQPLSWLYRPRFPLFPWQTAWGPFSWPSFTTFPPACGLQGETKPSKYFCQRLDPYDSQCWSQSSVWYRSNWQDGYNFIDLIHLMIMPGYYIF